MPSSNIYCKNDNDGGLNYTIQGMLLSCRISRANYFALNFTYLVIAELSLLLVTHQIYIKPQVVEINAE